MIFISVFHIFFSLFLVFYPFFFRRSKYDYVILFFIFTISWSWTLYKGECPLSYYLKKYNDPSYEIGDNLYSDDIFVLFGKRNDIVKYYYTLSIPIIQSITIYLLLARQNFSIVETYLYPILFYGYYYSSFLQSSMINGFFTIVFAYVLYRIVKQSRFI